MISKALENICYSRNTQLINKPPKNFKGNFTAFDRRLGTVDLIVGDVLSGFAISGAVYKNNYRNKENTLELGFLGIDVDNSENLKNADGTLAKDGNGKAIPVYKEQLTLEQALQHPYVKKFAAFIYTSPSHKPGWDRFRIIFPLESAISGDLADFLLLGLSKSFPGFDENCKDCSRLWYGNTNAEIYIIDKNNCIKDEDIAIAQKDYAEAQAEIQARKERGERLASEFGEYKALPVELSEEQKKVDYLLAQEALKYIPPRISGNETYPISLSVFAGLVRHFGKEVGLELVDGWSPEDKDTQGWGFLDRKAEGILRGGKRESSFGSVLFYAKEYNPDFDVATVRRVICQKLGIKYAPKEYEIPDNFISLPILSPEVFGRIIQKAGRKINSLNKKFKVIKQDKETEEIEAIEGFDEEEVDAIAWEWINKNPIDLVLTTNEEKARLDLVFDTKVYLYVPSVYEWFTEKGGWLALSKFKEEYSELFDYRKQRRVILDIPPAELTNKQYNLLKEKIGFAFNLKLNDVYLLVEGKEVHINPIVKEWATKKAKASLELLHKITPTDEVYTQYLGELDVNPEAKLIGVRSEKGTGKSVWMRQFIKSKQQKGASVIGIIHRTSLGKAGSVLSGIPYLKGVKDEGIDDGVFLCFDSLHYQSSIGKWLKLLEEKEDIWIVLDEIEQSLYHLLFASTTVQKYRSQILGLFQRLLAKALDPNRKGGVICLDADLSDMSLNFITKLAGLRQTKKQVFRNSYKKEGRDCLIYLDKDNWLETLWEALRQCREDKKNGVKQRSLHFVLQAQTATSEISSTVLAEKIRQEFEDLCVLVFDSATANDPEHAAYHALSSDLNKVLTDGVEDPIETHLGDSIIPIANPTTMGEVCHNAKAKLLNRRIDQAGVRDKFKDFPKEQIDVLITTQTVSTGISLDAKIFKGIYAACSGVGSIREACQAFERVRDGQGYKVDRHLYIAEESFPEDKCLPHTNPNVILQQLKEEFKLSLLTFEQQVSSEYQEEFNFDLNQIPQIKTTNINDAALTLYCNYLSRNNHEIHNYRELLVEYLRDKGFNIIEVEDSGDKEVKAGLKVAAKDIKAGHLQSVAEARDITKSEFEKLQSKNEKTRDQRLEYQKYKFKAKWGLESPTPAQIGFEEDGAYKKERMAYFLLDREEKAIAKDRKFLTSKFKDCPNPFLPDLHKGMVYHQIETLKASGIEDLVAIAQDNRGKMIELEQTRINSRILKTNSLGEVKEVRAEAKALEEELKQLITEVSPSEQNPELLEEKRSKLKTLKKQLASLNKQHKANNQAYAQTKTAFSDFSFTRSCPSITEAAEKIRGLTSEFKKFFGLKIKEEVAATEVVGQVLRLVGIDWRLSKSENKAEEKVRWYYPFCQTAIAFSQEQISKVHQYWDAAFKVTPEAVESKSVPHAA